MSTRRPAATWLVAALCVACHADRPAQRPLAHDVYVWQRVWSSEVGQALASAPSEIGTARILVRELAGNPRATVDISVDVAALAQSGREAVAVLRVHGAAPIGDVSLEHVAQVARSWRALGVRARGIEVDYDCAASALSAYADWLERERRGTLDLALSITALPSWNGSPALPRLIAAVDDVVVQVHAVRAPTLFDAEQARRDVDAWSKYTKREFRVALPTYRARLATGAELAADPADVARFLADLRARPVAGLTGIVWFRLGHRADPDAWSVSTLAAVVRGESLKPRIAARLSTTVPGALDVVLENVGLIDANAPAHLDLAGDLEILEGVSGYSARGSSLVARAPPRLRAGESVVIGFARGRGIGIAAP